MPRKAILLAAVLAVPAPAVLADLTADQTPFHTYRGLWVDRYDYSSNASIVTMLDRAKSLGITDVMFQVRGQADAYYFRSEGVEVYPQGRSITATNDPLQVAITEGHARGIKIHAWVNMMPLWNGSSLPSNPNHLINKHPEYWVRDASNTPQPLDGYVIVNPARPDVQAHLNDVVKTIAKNYDVDGIHMDYIRLYHANPGSTNVIDYPSDPYTVSLFQQQYPGQTPTSSPSNYKAWMASRITDLVRDVRATTKTWRPDAQLTAAVWRDPNIGLDSYQQHWARWVDEGLLDAAMPMIYREGFGSTDPGDLYRNNTTTAVDVRGSAGIMIGLGTYMQDDPAAAYANTMAQLNHAKAQGANGVQIFDYGTLFNNSAAQAEVRRAVQEFFAANDTPPPVATVADFEVGEGTFKWSPTLSGSNRGVASGTADLITGDGRSGSGSQRIVINKAAGAPDFRVRHLSGDPSAGDFNSNQRFASIGSVGVWLRTTTPDLRVSIAVDDTSTGDRGYLKNVIADGQWHRYEWFLNDVTHWDSWAGGNGEVEPIFAIDSVQFEGTADVNTVLMDDVYYDAAAVAPGQWTFDGNGHWSHSGNWTGGVPGIPGATRDVANLLRRITGGRTITLDRDVALDTLTIDNSAGYTLVGPGTLSLRGTSGTAAVNVVNRGGHTIAAEIHVLGRSSIHVDRGSTLTITGAVRNDAEELRKDGDGTLVLSGTQKHVPLTLISVNRGKLVLDADLGGVERTHHAQVVVNAASLDVRTTQHVNRLVVNGQASLVDGPTASDSSVFAHSLSFGSNGRIDIGRHALVIRPTASTRLAALAGVEARVRGGQIVSGLNDNHPLAGIAVIVNDDGSGGPLFATYRGETMSANDVISTLTYNGDANLDGRVNADDYFQIDSAFLSQIENPMWREGDFNYDDVVDADDYFLIDSAFLGQSGPLASAVGVAASVPEPASALLLLSVPLVLTRRVRRKGG